MSTTAMPVVDQTSPVKARFAFTRTRIFWVTFSVALIFNTVLFLAIFSAYTQGVEMGYEGEARFGFDKVAAGFSSLFGGFGSLVASLVILAVIVAALLIVRKLSKTGHHDMVVIAFALALIIGALFLNRALDNMMSLTLGFMPFVVLVGISALEALITMTILTIPSRKRDTH